MKLSMVTARAGGYFGRGTYLALAWIMSIITIPYAIHVLASGVRIAVEPGHNILWYWGDVIVVAQIAVTPLQFVSLSRATAGSMRAVMAAFVLALLLAGEITASVLLGQH